MSEFSEVENIKGEDYSWQREMWDPDILIGQREVEKLLSNSLFAERVVDAITKTDETHETVERKYWGREFGFIVGSKLKGRELQHAYTQLFEGEEESINLLMQDHRFSVDNIPDTDDRVITLAFHTHPAKAYLGRQELLGAIFKREPSTRSKIFLDHFSTIDLDFFKFLALDDCLSLIFALGTVEKGKKGSGKVVLITPQSFEALVNLEPKKLVKSIEEYKLTAGKDYLDAYREAGLNVAVLPVNLGSQPHFNPGDIELASKILTTRTY